MDVRSIGAGTGLGRSRTLLAAAAVLAAAPASPAAEGRSVPPIDRDRFDTVVIDPGHGGEDEGARGMRGLVEKDLVLDVAGRLATRLRAQGLRVVMTREDDATVPLETRTSIANDAGGDLFVSIHANAARVRRARGVETYFVALEASDAEARRVAARENRAFDSAPEFPAHDDPMVALLGDLIATEHVQESQVFARLAHEELAGAEADAATRGVKQAPFVVLMGVQMPAALVEIGFVSNPRDAAELGSEERRASLARSLARAVERFGRRYDAKRGLPRPGPSGAPGGDGERGPAAGRATPRRSDAGESGGAPQGAGPAGPGPAAGDPARAGGGG